MKKVLYLLGLTVIIISLGRVNSFTPRAEAGEQCFIRFKVFDDKIHDSQVADAALAKDSLISKGDLVNAVKGGKLPFDSKANNSKLVSAVLDNLEIEMCGKIDGCDAKTLDMAVVCELGTEPGSTGNTIRDAQLVYNDRIAGMNKCQQQIFKDIQIINSQYLKDVKVANVKYYQKLAPRTGTLLKLYRFANDDKEKSSIIEDYINYNKGLRKNLYEEQATIFNKFISSRTTIQEGFNFCK